MKIIDWFREHCNRTLPCSLGIHNWKYTKEKIRPYKSQRHCNHCGRWETAGFDGIEIVWVNDREMQKIELPEESKGEEQKKRPLIKPTLIQIPKYTNKIVVGDEKEVKKETFERETQETLSDLKNNQGIIYNELMKAFNKLEKQEEKERENNAVIIKMLMDLKDKL